MNGQVHPMRIPLPAPASDASTRFIVLSSVLVQGRDVAYVPPPTIAPTKGDVINVMPYTAIMLLGVHFCAILENKDMFFCFV